MLKNYNVRQNVRIEEKIDFVKKTNSISSHGISNCDHCIGRYNTHKSIICTYTKHGISKTKIHLNELFDKNNISSYLFRRECNEHCF